MLKHLILAGLALLGLIIGYILQRIAPEEIKPGKRYLVLLQKGIAIAVAIVIAVHLSNNLNSTLILLFASGLILSIILRIRYLALGIATFASIAVSQTVFFFVCLATFLYGFPTGTMISKRVVKEIVLRSVMFLIPAIMLFIEQPPMQSYALAFAAGALLGRR